MSLPVPPTNAPAGWMHWHAAGFANGDDVNEVGDDLGHIQMRAERRANIVLRSVAVVAASIVAVWGVVKQQWLCVVAIVKG